MKKLTRRAENLLKEIMDHRNEKGVCDTLYWKEQFNSLSVSEDTMLRSLFKELEDANMIAVKWADNYPYIILLLGNGIAYFEEKESLDDEKTKNTNVNNFYGSTNNVQIQQGTINSTQSFEHKQLTDESTIKELINMIRKYNSVLEKEYGNIGAEKLREAIEELTGLLRETKPSEKKDNRAKEIVAYIRDLSVNAGGGLIASGILQLIASLPR